MQVWPSGELNSNRLDGLISPLWMIVSVNSTAVFDWNDTQVTAAFN